MEENETQSRIKKFMNLNLSDNFTVLFDDSTVCKMDCYLYGPILIITDPSKLVGTCTMYLPDWNMTITQVNQHKSLLFEPNNPDLTAPTLKIKSSRTKVILDWYSTINKNVYDLKELKIRDTILNVRLLIKGSFLRAQMVVTMDHIKFIRSKVVLTARRAPDLYAIPQFDTPYRIALFDNHKIVAVVSCSNFDHTRKVLLSINARPSDLTTMPQVILDQEGEIPQIETGFLDSNIPEDKKDITDEQKQEAVAKSIAESHIAIPDMSSEFLGKVMEAKMDIIMQKPRFSGNMPEKKETMDRIIKQTAPMPDNICPALTQYDIEEEIEDDEGLFQIPRDQIDTLAYYKTNPVMQQTDDITLLNVIDHDWAYEIVNDNVNLEKYHFSAEHGMKTPCEQVIDIFNHTPKSQMPFLAAGVFLQGRRVPIPILSEALFKMHFSIKEISDLVKSKSFRTEQGCAEFFVKFFELHVASLLFAHLSNMTEIKNFYHADAIMRCPVLLNQFIEICDIGDEYFARSLVDPLPLVAFHVPELRIAAALKELITNIPTLWIEGERNLGYTPPLSEIIAEILYVIGGTLADISVIDFNQVWELIIDPLIQHDPYYMTIFMKVNKIAKASAEKTIGMILSALVDQHLPEMIIGALSFQLIPQQYKTQAVSVCSQIIQLQKVINTKTLKVTKKFICDLTNQVKIVILKSARTPESIKKTIFSPRLSKSEQMLQDLVGEHGMDITHAFNKLVKGINI